MNKQSGFTLVELLIVIAVMAVLLGIGVPSFRETIQLNRIATVSNDLIAALQFARSEAVRRGQDVTLCSSADQTTCSGVWINGWVARTAVGTIRAWPRAREGVTIAVSGPVVFNALGGVTAGRCFEVDLDSRKRSVTVGAGGRIVGSVIACP